MKKQNVLFIIAAIVLGVFLTSCDKSTDPEDTGFNYPLQKGNSWNYDVYSLDGMNTATSEVITTHTITLGDMESLDDKEAYPLINSNPATDQMELFTHISADQQGVYLFIGELDLNNFIQAQETKIPSLTIGWIKVFDYDDKNWESFFIDYNGEIDGKKVKAKIAINGFNEGTKSVSYLSSNYDAIKVKLNLDVEATVESGGNTISQTGVSDIQFEFIDGVGIYSLQQNVNEVVGINKGYKEVLTGHSL